MKRSVSLHVIRNGVIKKDLADHKLKDLQGKDRNNCDHGLEVER